MARDRYITAEDRPRITEIQDSLIERYVEQKAAIREGNRCRAIGLSSKLRGCYAKRIKSSTGRSFDRPGQRSAPFERSAN